MSYGRWEHRVDFDNNGGIHHGIVSQFYKDGALLLQMAQCHYETADEYYERLRKAENNYGVTTLKEKRYLENIIRSKHELR